MIALGVEPDGGRRGHNARSPNDGASVDAIMVQRDTTPIATGHARGGPHVHAHAGEGALGISGKILGQGRQQARACLEQNDARTAGIDPAKIVGQCLPRNLSDGPSHFDPGRSSADDDKREQTLPFGFLVRELGVLECQQNPSTNAGRVLDTLESGRELRPFVVSEIGVRRSGRNHEVVVGNRACSGLNQPPGKIEAGNLRHQHCCVALLAQHVPDGPSDLGRRQRSGRHLVEQRLKAMVVLAVQDDHVDGNTGERFRCCEAAEAPTHDDNLGTVR